MSEEQVNNKQSNFLDDAMDLLESVIFSVFIIVLIFTYLFRIATVEGDSMRETLHDGDRLIVSHLFYTPEQGDIVIVNCDEGHVFSDESETEIVSTNGLDKRIVKRVIAKGGQTVDIDFTKGIVYVDGEEMDEPYIKESTDDDEGAFIYPITIPEGYVFVMGDNRGNSTDSRSPLVGLVKEEDIIGKVMLRMYPFDVFGSVY